MVKIDIEKIMDEIREEIQEKGYIEDLPSFKECCDSYYDEVEKLLDESYNTQNYAYIEEYPVWETGGFINKFKAFIKKVIRKSIKFYIVPIIEKQNAFNRLVGDSCVNVSKYLSDEKSEIDKMRKKIIELEKKCSNLEKRIEEEGK